MVLPQFFRLREKQAMAVIPDAAPGCGMIRGGAMGRRMLAAHAGATLALIVPAAAAVFAGEAADMMR